MVGAILVTGGARRIGHAISMSLASNDFHIVIQTRKDDDEVSKIKNEIDSLGKRCFVVEGNLDDSNSVEKIFDSTVKMLSEFEIPFVGLVNSASMFQWDDPSNVESHSLVNHYQVNAVAPILLSKMFYDLSKKISVERQPNLDSCIVNILDQKLMSPHPDHFSYTLSKQALSAATVMMAKSYAPICRVNSVSPGHVLASPDQTAEGFAKAQAESPLGYGPSPSDIGEAVVFLFGAKSITAQTLVVDAGEHLLGRLRDVVFETED